MEVIETTGAQPDLEGEVIRVERMYIYRQVIRAAVYVFAYIPCIVQPGLHKLWTVLLS